MKRVGRIELKYLKQVLKSEFRSSKSVGMVSKLENRFANFIGTKYAIGFVNGTATLHTSLEALGIGPGDEVIVPPLTMSATAFSVLQTGATPIFADVDLETFQISPKAIANKISKNTKAIMTVSLYGGSPDYCEINKNVGSIPIIEDNAESIGATYNNQNLGTFGLVSSYSFQSSKHITAGEGGMICTNSLEIADRVRKIQSLGYSAVGATVQKIDKKVIQNPSYERHEILGWNYRMSELTAAVVLGQLEHAQELIATRIETGNQIYEIASKFEWLKTQKTYKNSNHSFWAAPILLDRQDISWEKFRDKFMENGGKGIYAAWKLSYLEPVFRDRKFLNREKKISAAVLKTYKEGLCKNAEYLQPKILAFRTNEWSKKQRTTQLKALEKTLKYFDNKIIK